MIDLKREESDATMPSAEHISRAAAHSFGPINEIRQGDEPGPQMPHILRCLTSEERARLETKLLRKLDYRLLPMIMVMYILNYLDRTNIASARFAGLEDDLQLDSSGTQFSTAVSILYAGYVIMQVPSNLLLNKIGKPGKYLPSAMIIWGIISATLGACRSYQGLLAARFLLGFVEAAYFPGSLYYLSCWYTRKELGLRTTYMYAGSLLSGAFSGLIAAGITHNLDGSQGLRAWRWLFIIEGSMTVAVAILALFVLPDMPRTTTWLNEEELALATWRLQEDIGQDDWISSEEQRWWHGFKLALIDVKTWVLLLMLLGNVAASTVTNFLPTIVSTLQYSDVVTLVLTSPPYVLALITTFATAWHADKTGERFYHFAIPLSVALIAFIISASTVNTAARYAAIMLMIPGLYSGYTTGLAWISNTLPRPPAKRAAALAFINATYNMSSIYSSYLYPKSAGPRYMAAWIHNCVLAAVGIFAAFVLKKVLTRLNEKLDRAELVTAKEGVIPKEAVDNDFRFLV